MTYYMPNDSTNPKRALYVRQDGKYVKIGTIDIKTHEVTITAVSGRVRSGSWKKSMKWKWKTSHMTKGDGLE